MIEKSPIEILEELGYRLCRRNNYYQTAALYRDGNDPTSVAIYPNKGLFIDFVTGQKGSLELLIAKSIGIDEKQLPEWLASNEYFLIPKDDKPQMDKQPLILDNKELLSILPIHDYWIKRGISLETLKTFRGGEIRENHPMKDRYVNPIFNSKQQVVGLSGRTLTGAKNKYKHIGDKQTWCYPAFLNWRLLVNNTLILVESIGCVFSLWEMGIKNVLCLFGTSLNKGIVNFIIRAGCQRVVIATNNEESMKGNDAADAIADFLKGILAPDDVKIMLPFKKDFNEMLMDNPESILRWNNYATARN